MNYCGERLVRQALIERVNNSHENGPLRIVPELNLCQAEARIDLAAINGRLCGWEIKTAGDTLTRLPSQQAVYSRIFDRLWLVADGRHLERSMNLVPEWWGVIRIDGDGESCRLVEKRRSRLNPSVELASLVRLLWRSEALGELEVLGLADGLERAPRSVLWARLASAAPRHIPPTHLRERVRARLIGRTGWRSD